MAAPKGNQFWKARSSHGRKPKFANPDSLWEACCEYFEWVAANPLQAAELVKFKGKANIKHTPRMRAMTIRGLCIFLDIGQDAWGDYAGKDDFSGVCTRANEIISQQKFEGAAADMLNAAIIARDLGLAEKKDIRVAKLEDLVDWEDDDVDDGD
jgi:hypothetical protein